MNKIKLTLSALLVAGAALFAPAASAQTCDECVTAAVEAVNQTVSDTKSAIVSAIDTSTKALINAHGRIAEAQAKVNVAGQQMQKLVDVKEKYQTSPAACQVAGVADVAQAAHSDTTAQQSSFTGTLLDRKLNPDAAYAERMRAFTDAIKKYAPDGSMPNADVNVDSLLNGAGKPGKTKSLTFNKEQIEAGGRYIMNAVSAGTPPPLDSKYANTEEGRKYEMMRREIIAQLSLAQKIHADALSYRTPVNSLNGASLEEFVSAQINGRYGNKNWLVGLERRGGQNSLIKDGLYMQALNLKLQQMQLEHLEKMELALAQILDRSSGSSDKINSLNAQRQRATALAK